MKRYRYVQYFCNITYGNQNNSKAAIFTSSPVDMKQYTNRWSELTNTDFKVGYTSTSVSGSNGSSGAGVGSGSFSCSCTCSYSSETGILSFSSSGGSKTWGQYNSSNYTTVSGTPYGTFAVWLGTVNGE